MRALGARPPVARRYRRAPLQRAPLCCSTPPPRIVAPSFALSAEEAFAAQWDALAANDTPHVDHGVEVLYSFADVDLFLPRSRYFGPSADLGQFERFRRNLHTPRYRALLGHTERRVQSTLRVSEREVWQRVFVRGFRTGEVGCYCLTLRQQLGGRRDGFWLASSLSCDGTEPVLEEDGAP